MTNTYLFLDTETGGLDPRVHSLLTLGLVVGDADGVKDSLEIAVKHGPGLTSPMPLEFGTVRQHGDVIPNTANGWGEGLAALGAFSIK